METPEMAGPGRVVGSGLAWLVKYGTGELRPFPEIPVSPEEEAAWIELERRLAGGST